MTVRTTNSCIMMKVLSSIFKLWSLVVHWWSVVNCGPSCGYPLGVNCHCSTELFYRGSMWDPLCIWSLLLVWKSKMNVTRSSCLKRLVEKIFKYTYLIVSLCPNCRQVLPNAGTLKCSLKDQFRPDALIMRVCWWFVISGLFIAAATTMSDSFTYAAGWPMAI